MKLIECPRDAMQGIKDFIPTQTKIDYMNTLLQVGFDTLDFGSYVSAKAIPQMKDTDEVLEKLDLDSSLTNLLAIVANVRGAQAAAEREKISYLGYPFSISETFQLRNTNRTIGDALADLGDIQNLCLKYNKKLVVYISMGFGNPYGEEWSVELVQEWAEKLSDLEVEILSLSDTIGQADPADVKYLFEQVIKTYPDMEVGAHFHSRPDDWQEKIDEAYAGGCRRFDSAMKGFGGCPMAKDDLVGNIATEKLVNRLEQQGENLGLNKEKLEEALQQAGRVFG